MHSWWYKRTHIHTHARAHTTNFMLPSNDFKNIHSNILRFAERLLSRLYRSSEVVFVATPSRLPWSWIPFLEKISVSNQEKKCTRLWGRKLQKLRFHRNTQTSSSQAAVALTYMLHATNTPHNPPSFVEVLVSTRSLPLNVLLEASSLTQNWQCSWRISEKAGRCKRRYRDQVNTERWERKRALFISVLFLRQKISFKSTDEVENTVVSCSQFRT